MNAARAAKACFVFFSFREEEAEEDEKAAEGVLDEEEETLWAEEEGKGDRIEVSNALFPAEAKTSDNWRGAEAGIGVRFLRGGEASSREGEVVEEAEKDEPEEEEPDDRGSSNSMLSMSSRSPWGVEGEGRMIT